jgi:hypothetical protein
MSDEQKPLGDEPKRKKLTLKQSRLVAALPKAKTAAAAAIEAGYSPKNPDQSAYQALKAIEKTMPEMMIELGLTNKSLIENHLVPLLRAERVGLYGTVPDGPTRLGALKLAGEWKGVNAQRDEEAERDRVRSKTFTVRLVVADERRAIRLSKLLSHSGPSGVVIDVDAGVDGNVG